MRETLFSLSACDSLSAFYPTQHTAAYIHLTHQEILHQRQKTVAPQKTRKKKNHSHLGHRGRKSNPSETEKKIQESVDSLEVFPFSLWSDLLISLLFWRIGIRYRAFVEGSMCPPKHFPNTRVSAPSLPPFSSLVCQITFPTQPQYPRQQPLLWACTISEGMVSVVHVMPVWLGGNTWRGKKILYKLLKH